MTTLPPDQLNSIGVLKRREIEARILAPFVDALAEAYERDQVVSILRDTIISVAQDQGAELATVMGGDDLPTFAKKMDAWTQDDALHIEILEESDTQFDFNITRCRYAELYHALGIPELGAVLSCNRDYSLIEGFNADVSLTRTQTIMQGASHCNFRYRLDRPEVSGHE